MVKYFKEKMVNDMKRKAIYKLTFKAYLKAMMIFIVFIMICSISFFFYIKKDIENESVNKVVANTEKQTESLKQYIDIQYRYLEGVGNHISQQDLFCEDNINLIHSIKEYTKLENVGIIDKNGESHYDNGAVKNVSNREYFQEALKGNRVLSASLESVIAGETRVIIAVPIYDQQKEIVGVIGGSYDIGDLNKIVFRGIYDGKGSAFLVSKEGQLITYDNAVKNKDFLASESIFSYFAEYNVLSPDDLQSLKQKWIKQENGYMTLNYNNKTSYMAYYPLKINDWIMCYNIDADVAQESYTFIIYAEYLLFTLFVFALVILLFTIYKVNNKHQKRLLEFVRIDALTGIKNKETLQNEISTYLKNDSSQQLGALFMIDVDNFKTVNDLNDHVIGDEVLKNFGSILKESFTIEDIVGRAGGDEFIAFVKDIQEHGNAINKAQEICQKIRNIEIDNFKGTISCSIGIAFYPEHGTTFKGLYNLADQALYQTKNQGRNGYTCYTK